MTDVGVAKVPTNDTDYSVRQDCDTGCPARALVFVDSPSGLELSFCGHHYADSAALLALSHFEVKRDERDSLLPKVPVAE